MSLTNYNFKPDANKIKALYSGDFEEFYRSLFNENFNEAIKAYWESEFPDKFGFKKFCKGVCKVKQIENRELKIDSILK